MFGWLTGGDAEEAPKEVKVREEKEKEKESEGTSTPVVMVKCLWPDAVEKPKEGTWVGMDLNLKLRAKTQAQPQPAMTWEVHDTRDDGLPTLSHNDTVYVVKPITKDLEYPLPELFQPTWVAIGTTDVQWLQKETPGRLIMLTQPKLMCNGSCIGKRQYLINEIAEEEEGKAVVDVDYTKAAYKQCALNLGVEVTWKEEVKDDELGEKINVSLPKWAQYASLEHSCFCWVIHNGWLGSSNTPTWLVLHGKSLHYSQSPTATDYHEFSLKNVTVEALSMIVGPNRMMQYPLKVKNKAGEVFEVTFYTEGERDLWCAMIDITSAQLNLNKKIPEERVAIYERLLTQVFIPKPAPCVDPFASPDELPSCVASGYVIVQSQTGGWLTESWKRRWVTVHDTFFTFRDNKSTSDMTGFEVCRFHYNKILKAPQKDHPWVFVLYNPFTPPVHIWCDSKAGFAKWLGVFDTGVHTANPNMGCIEVGTIPQVGRPFIAGHEMMLRNGYPALPFVSESSFRHLVTEDGVVGSEEAEAVVEDGELKWKGEGGVLSLLTPKHYVVRGKRWNDPKPTPTTVTDCLLPESVLGAHASIPSLAPTSCVLLIFPTNTRTTPRSDDTHTTFLVLQGTLQITIFPGSCYTQITPYYPAIRASNFDQPLPPSWGSSQCPVAYKGGRTVEIPTGKYMYVPVDHFYAIRVTSEAVVLKCSYKKA